MICPSNMQTLWLCPPPVRTEWPSNQVAHSVNAELHVVNDLSRSCSTLSCFSMFPHFSGGIAFILHHSRSQPHCSPLYCTGSHLPIPVKVKTLTTHICMPMCVRTVTHTCTQPNNSLTFMLDQLLMSWDISSCWSKVKDLVLSFPTVLPLLLELSLCLSPSPVSPTTTPLPPNWPLSVNFAWPSPANLPRSREAGVKIQSFNRVSELRAKEAQRVKGIRDGGS